MYALTPIFFLVTAFQSLTMSAMNTIRTLEDITNLTVQDIKTKYKQQPGQADFIAGIKFLKGLGLPKASPESAFKFFLRSAEHRTDAIFELKKMYENGLHPLYQDNPDILYKAALKIGAVDSSTMIKIFHELADTHHYAQACLALGELYEEGKIVKQNLPEALAYYTQAAEYGSAQGNYRTGQLYLQGSGTDQNKKKAFDYIQRAAELKLRNAIFDMGVFYLAGDASERDISKAIDYFKQASELGDSDAYMSLGTLAQEGFQEDGTQGEPDHKKAFDLFKKAYEKGNIKAHYELAFYYHIGLNVATDHAFAQKLYNEVVQSEDSTLALIKARMYEFGVGVEQDLEKAQIYYKQALADGNNVQKYIDIVDAKIVARKHDENTGASEDDVIKIPDVEKVKKTSVTRSARKKPTAEHVAYTQLKSAEADFMEKLNEKFPCPDESVITQVDFINDLIRIERPSDNTQVIIEIDPKNKQLLKRLKTYTYHDRVNTWFEELKNTESFSTTEYDSLIRHAFPQKTDYICQLFGYKTVSKIKGHDRLTLAIQGQLIPGETGIPRNGSFIYGYNPAGNVRNPLLYHRFHHNPT